MAALRTLLLAPLALLLLLLLGSMEAMATGNAFSFDVDAGSSKCLG
jgi:hypothetical protein